MPELLDKADSKATRASRTAFIVKGTSCFSHHLSPDFYCPALFGLCSFPALLDFRISLPLWTDLDPAGSEACLDLLAPSLLISELFVSKSGFWFGYRLMESRFCFWLFLMNRLWTTELELFWSRILLVAGQAKDPPKTDPQSEIEAALMGVSAGCGPVRTVDTFSSLSWSLV